MILARCLIGDCNHGAKLCINPKGFCMRGRCITDIVQQIDAIVVVEQVRQIKSKVFFLNSSKDMFNLGRSANNKIIEQKKDNKITY
jgi:hypothetical protein